MKREDLLPVLRRRLEYSTHHDGARQNPIAFSAIG